MKKTLTILTVAAVCCTACLKENEPGLGSEGKPVTRLVGNPFGEKAEGQLLVNLSESAVKALNEGTLDSESIVKGLEGAQMNAVFPGEANAVARKHGLHKWYSVSFDSSVSVETAASLLSERTEIEAIEYNSFLKATFSPESYEYVEGGATKSTASITEALPFNDIRLKDQWNLINDGTLTGAIAGADVGVKDAWKLTAGDSRVVVAVFDQGIAISHPDLKDALWCNDAEINGTDGKDDDGNGYVDDKYGYNFAEEKGKPSYCYDGDHGTHVAGTIAATNNNGQGVSSIAGGTGARDGVRIMSCQIFGKDGQQCSVTKVAKAFRYAADMGACIAQCSYGYTDMEGFSAEEVASWMEESLEYHAMQYFLDKANANCDALESNLAIFSAGNYNKAASLFPGAVKECISVTAYGPDYLPGGYSNYGAGCDIAAPGGDIVEGNPNAPCMILSTGIGSNNQMSYIYKYGTSMACPHVSGVAALGASYALKIGKRFSAEDFKSLLLTSANDMDRYIQPDMTKLMVSGYDYIPVDIFCKKGKMGTGAVDAWRFLMALEGTPSYMTKPDQKLSLNLAEIFGADHGKYTLEMSAEAKEALGITHTPSVTDGILELTCTKIGSGKILFKASVGKDDAGVIPELDYYREISIVSRPAVASNGGWL